MGNFAKYYGLEIGDLPSDTQKQSMLNEKQS